MTEDPIYLDHNATTPILPEVFEAMLPYLRDHHGNPSSDHVYGRRTRTAVREARADVAGLLRCSEDELYFTSGGTEASNLAIRGVLEARTNRNDRTDVVTSVIEHPATSKPCAWLEKRGHRVVRLPVDSEGCIRLDAAQETIGPQTGLVTVIHANNETGVLQPVADLARLARKVGALVHTDAAQSLGKVSVTVRDLDVDLISIAGHKLYAPKGVGALYVRSGVSVEPLVRGAGHERGLRPGTENVAYIVGLGAACRRAARDLDAEAERVKRLRDLLFARLAEDVEGLRINGHPELRLPNTLNVCFPGATGSAVLANAPEVAASTGSACHEGLERPSDVIVAMGLPAREALGSVRLTLGRSTTEEDVGRAAAALVRAWRTARNTG